VTRKDGTPQWKFKTRRKVDASPVITGDKVVFGSGDGRLYLLSLKDGKELWNYDVGKAIYSSPAVVDDMIIVGTGDHRVYAFHAPVSGK
jgi:outer membrane protein assembly factor BamB